VRTKNAVAYHALYANLERILCGGVISAAGAISMHYL
jgi:hypothetical protein